MIAIPTESIAHVVDPEEIAYYSCLSRKAPSISVATETTAEPVGTNHRNGKKKLLRKPSGEHVVDLTSDDEEDKHEAPVACSSCFSALTYPELRFSAPCGHLLCRYCLIERCRIAISNHEDTGGDSMPVQCCGNVIPLDVIQAAVTRRDFAKYSDLLAKFETINSSFPDSPGITRGQKRKARPAAHAEDGLNARAQENSQFASPAQSPGVGGDVEDCVSCMTATNANESVKCPCGHIYCLDCLGYLAKLSVRDRAMIPIRCCEIEFPEEFVARVLSAKNMTLYRRFVAEKSSSESTLKSDKEYAALVAQIQGKQCPRCGVGVQRVAGCRSMTCPFGHPFYWLCGHHPCACTK